MISNTETLDNSNMSAKDKLTAGLFRHQTKVAEVQNGNEGEDERQENEDNNSFKAKKYSKKKKKKNSNSRGQSPTEDKIVNKNNSSSNSNSVVEVNNSRFSGRPGHCKPNRWRSDSRRQ